MNWINFKDKLPAYDKDVLIWEKNGDRARVSLGVLIEKDEADVECEKCCQESNHRIDYKGTILYCNYTDASVKYFALHGITQAETDFYWMPLPEAPK